MAGIPIVRYRYSRKNLDSANSLPDWMRVIFIRFLIRFLLHRQQQGAIFPLPPATEGREGKPKKRGDGTLQTVTALTDMRTNNRSGSHPPD